MSRLEDHNRELRRMLGFVVGFGVLAAASYAVPGTESVRPWMPGEPVPLVHLLAGTSRVVETHPGVLVSRSTDDDDAAAELPAEGDTGDPDGADDVGSAETSPDARATQAPLPPDSVPPAAAEDVDDGAGVVAASDIEDGEVEDTLDVEATAVAADTVAADAVAADTVAADAIAAQDAVATTPSPAEDPSDADADPPGDDPDDGDALAMLSVEGEDAVLADLADAPPDGLSDGLSDDSAAPAGDTGKAEARTPMGPPRDPALPNRSPARGTPLEVPPGALDAWFSALRQAENGEPGHIVRALHWGDSTIAGDGITRTVRRRLQERFGDGGPGFLSVQVDRRWSSRPGVARYPEGDWKTLTITFGGAEMAYYGLAGTVSTATGEASSTLGGLKLDDGTRQPLHHFDLFYQVQPGGGSFYAQAKDGPGVGVGTASASRGDAFRALDVPEGAETLRIGTTGDGPVSLYGVALETDGPGMTWETFGVAGAGPGSMFRQGKNHLSRQIARRDPHLLVYQMGGNELGLPSLKAGDGHLWKERYIKVVQRLRAGAPDASCLLITPLDQGVRHRGGIQSKPTLDRMVQLQREAAFDLGCAFWDARYAMGGDGSFARWLSHEPALAWSDLSHLTNRGLNIMGHTLADAIERSYDQWARQTPGPARLVQVGGD